MYRMWTLCGESVATRLVEPKGKPTTCPACLKVVEREWVAPAARAAWILSQIVKRGNIREYRLQRKMLYDASQELRQALVLHWEAIPQEIRATLPSEQKEPSCG